MWRSMTPSLSSALAPGSDCGFREVSQSPTVSRLENPRGAGRAFGRGPLCALARLPDLQPPGPSRSPQNSLSPAQPAARSPPPRPAPSLQPPGAPTCPASRSGESQPADCAPSARRRVPRVAMGTAGFCDAPPARGRGQGGAVAQDPGVRGDPAGWGVHLKSLGKTARGGSTGRGAGGGSEGVGGALSDPKTQTGTRTLGAPPPAPDPALHPGLRWTELSRGFAPSLGNRARLGNHRKWLFRKPSPK